MKRLDPFRAVSCAVLLVSVALLFGCAAKEPRTPVGVMDSPAHHFQVGERYLDQGDALRAGEAFDLALSIDRDHAPSVAGKGVILAMQGERGEALDLVDDALDTAEDADDVSAQVTVLTLAMRAHAALYRSGAEQRQDALEAVDDAFEDAQNLDPAAPGPWFYRGEAYADALDLRTAESMYRAVVNLGGDYARRAEACWKLVQDVQRLSPGTTVGTRIALVSEMTRADMAALLVEEFGIDTFYSRTDPGDATTFRTPGQEQASAALDVAEAVRDVDGHPLADDVRRVLHYGVKGLEAYPDRTFRPDDPLTRAEAAMIVEDVIIRATGKGEIATKYIGRESGPPDLRPDHPAFNASMVAITRGILEVDVRNGRFRPFETLSGIEALAAIKRLRAELSLF